MQIRNICLLGGSGFIGQHLAARLHARGYQVKVLTRDREQARENLIVLPTVSLVEADIRDPATLAREFAGMDAVINLVGILHEKKRGDFARVHADLPRRVISAARAAGVRRLLHMSALNAGGDGLSDYLRSKGEGERAALAAHGDALKVTVFRPSVVFGRGDSFLALFDRLLGLTPALLLPCPQARFQPVWVGDVAEAFAASVDQPATWGKAYDLCGPRVYTFVELVRYVAALKQRRPLIVGLGNGLSKAYGALMEWLPVKLFTRDNWRSMQQANVCHCPFPAGFGVTPAALEAIAPDYLADDTPRRRLDAFRARKPHVDANL